MLHPKKKQIDTRMHRRWQRKQLIQDVVSKANLQNKKLLKTQTKEQKIKTTKHQT